MESELLQNASGSKTIKVIQNYYLLLSPERAVGSQKNYECQLGGSHARHLRLHFCTFHVEIDKENEKGRHPK